MAKNYRSRTMTKAELREIEKNPWKSAKEYYQGFQTVCYETVRLAVNAARKRYMAEHPDESVGETAGKYGVSYDAIYYWINSRSRHGERRKTSGFNRPYTAETAYLIRRWAEQGDSIEKIADALGRTEKNVREAFEPKHDAEVEAAKLGVKRFSEREMLSIANMKKAAGRRKKREQGF